MNQPAPWGVQEPPLAAAAAAAAPPQDPAPLERPEPEPLRHAPFGVPTSITHGRPPVEITSPGPGFGTKEVAAAWVAHLRLTVNAAREVLAALPHGAVVDALHEGGELVAQVLARGL